LQRLELSALRLDLLLLRFDLLISDFIILHLVADRGAGHE